MEDLKYGGWTKNWVNGEFHLILDGRISKVIGQDQIVQSRSYCYSSISVASVDEIKKQPMKDYHNYQRYLALFLYKWINKFSGELYIRAWYIWCKESVCLYQEWDINEEPLETCLTKSVLRFVSHDTAKTVWRKIWLQIYHK